MQAIHCKLSCNEQNRRFLFVGTEFSSLFSLVQRLLALDKEFVLKYKDTDGDLITLTSNEELACALLYSDGNILRLVAIPKDEASETAWRGRGGKCHRHGGPGHFPGGWEHGGHCHFYGGHGWKHMHGDHGHFHGGWEHGGHRHFHGGHGCHGWKHMQHMHGGHGHFHSGWGSEMFKAKLISKRDFFKSQLDELEKVPEQQQEILRLQKKLKKIESRLEGGWEMKGKHCAKWVDKMEKRRQKMEKRTRKREQKLTIHLSEETQTQIATLKSQIDLLKPAMKEVKSQIKSKKDALKEAKATGGDPHHLLKEIMVLKDTREAQKSQVKPLKQKIRDLKYASC